MIEIILLAGALSVGLEPYAVENQEPDTHDRGTNTDAQGGSFQWTTRRAKPGAPITQDKDNFHGDGVERDQFGRPIEPED